MDRNKSSSRQKDNTKNKEKKKKESTMGSVLKSALGSNDSIANLNSTNNVVPISNEAMAIFVQFPTDVLEEIFVRLIDFPKDRLTPSSWKNALQVM